MGDAELEAAELRLKLAEREQLLASAVTRLEQLEALHTHAQATVLRAEDGEAVATAVRLSARVSELTLRETAAAMRAEQAEAAAAATAAVVGVQGPYTETPLEFQGPD